MPAYQPTNNHYDNDDNDDEGDNDDGDHVYLLIGRQTAIGAFRYKRVGLWIKNLLNGWNGEM